MFEDFYNFKNTPFSRTIPTKNLYKGNDSDELIERLKYAANRQLFAVVVGPFATHKPRCCRQRTAGPERRRHCADFATI